MRLLWFLAVTLAMLTLADFYTTWASLHQPIPGWEVLEINPISALLFEWLGLVPGLILDTALGIALIVFIARTRRLNHRWRIGVLVSLVLFTAYVVVNNYLNMVKIGIA